MPFSALRLTSIDNRGDKFEQALQTGIESV